MSGQHSVDSAFAGAVYISGRGGFWTLFLFQLYWNKWKESALIVQHRLFVLQVLHHITSVLQLSALFCAVCGFCNACKTIFGGGGGSVLRICGRKAFSSRGAARMEKLWGCVRGGFFHISDTVLLWYYLQWYSPSMIPYLSTAEAPRYPFATLTPSAGLHAYIIGLFGLDCFYSSTTSTIMHSLHISFQQWG